MAQKPHTLPQSNLAPVPSGTALLDSSNRSLSAELESVLLEALDSAKAEAATVSFREIAVTIRAVNHASAEFNRIQTDAETLATELKVWGAIAGIGAAGTAIGYVANQFGLLNDAQAKVFNWQ